MASCGEFRRELWEWLRFFRRCAVVFTKRDEFPLDGGKMLITARKCDFFYFWYSFVPF